MSSSTRSGDAEVLTGAKAIGSFLGLKERQVRHMHEKGHLPTFKIGDLLAARPARLRAWLDEQERKAAGG